MLEILILLVLGLCLGSFVNALVWRLHEQEELKLKVKGSKVKGKGKSKKAVVRGSRFATDDLSILKGRSMCPHCRHKLAVKDLVPVLSWLSVRGKCRYCRKPISAQYPVVEVATALLFVWSYVFWPMEFNAQGWINFAGWVAVLTGFMALLVYDVFWMILPNKIIAVLAAVAGALLAVNTFVYGGGVGLLGNTLFAVLIGGGIFWVLFQVSRGKWIGGGDVKLGALIGLLMADPGKSLLVLFLASCLGSLMAVPLLITKKATRTSQLPFGPFLIIAAIIVYLWGVPVLEWYKNTFLFY